MSFPIPTSQKVILYLDTSDHSIFLDTTSTLGTSIINKTMQGEHGKLHYSSRVLQASDGSKVTEVDNSKKTFTSYTVNFRSTEQSSEEEFEHDSTDTYSSDTSWPNVEIPGTWGTYGLEDNPWNDELKPVVRLRDYEDLTLTEEEQKGVLTERIVACCSSYLDKIPEIGKYALCKCDLLGKKLQDISVLTYHHYLQYLNLSHNELTDLEPLGQLPFLMYLDVSHNILTEVLNFKPPFNLTYVNFSHNFVDVVDDLSAFWSLVFLDISHNQIYYIKGLQNLKYLRYLNLSYNQIKELRNLNHLRLVHLNLENNKIEKFESDEYCGLHTLKELIGINLSYNNIKSLEIFKNVDGLQKIVMVYNKIDHLIELENVKNLMYLTEVDFRNNPFCNQKSYYEMCISLIKPLVVLDGSFITSEEKVLVKCKHQPPPVVEASRRRANLLLLEKLMKFEVDEITIPISKPVPPIMILVGPPGNGQRHLIREFYAKYQKYLKIGVSHTTRPIRENEIDAVDYYFVTEDEFKQLTRGGEFIAISDFMGYSYGFCRNELLKVINEQCVLLFHTDLIGAITLRMRSLRPVLILTVFQEEEAYYEKLVKSICYTRWDTGFNSRAERKIMRLGVDCAQVEEEMLSASSQITELVEDVIHYMKDDQGKAVIVTFDDSTAVRQRSLSVDTENVSENISAESTKTEELISLTQTPSQKRIHSVSFHLASQKVAHSISESGIGADTQLSTVSQYGIVEEDEESSDFEAEVLKPSDHVENFINEVLNTRRSYINFHDDNPGFFLDVVFTEKHDEAMVKLAAILRSIVEKKKEPHHTYSYDKDPCFEEMLTDRLNLLYSEMYSEMFVSDDQQPKCWEENTIRDLQ